MSSKQYNSVTQIIDIHQLTDEELVTRALNGEILAEYIFIQRDHLKHVVKRASQLSIGTGIEIYLSAKLRVRFQTTAANKVEMVIPYDSLNEVKQYRRAITAWQNYLDHIQGNIDPDSVVLEAYLKRRERGISPATIAESFKRKAVSRLRRYVERQAALENSTMTEEERREWKMEMLDWEVRYCAAKRKARTEAERKKLDGLECMEDAYTSLFDNYLVPSMLEELGASPGLARQFCSDLIECLRSGNPLPKDYPLIGEQVREKLRYFDKQIKLPTTASA